MKKDIEIREKIIDAAAELINESKGDIEAITIRSISKKADVSVGLINYHFQTKENLINICVEKIIEKVITEFRPITDDCLSSTEKLKATAKSVADFLMDNQSVSRISILSDFNKPQECDNTMKTVKDFCTVSQGSGIPDKNRKILAYALTSILQALFLRKDISKDVFGLDFCIKKDRDSIIDFIVDNLFREGK